MRATPHDFVRRLSNNELSGKMKIRAKWGNLWEVEISTSWGKSAWEKSVRDNFLGDNEILNFELQVIFVKPKDELLLEDSKT